MPRRPPPYSNLSRLGPPLLVAATWSTFLALRLDDPIPGVVSVWLFGMIVAIWADEERSWTFLLAHRFAGAWSLLCAALAAAQTLL